MLIIRKEEHLIYVLLFLIINVVYVIIYIGDFMDKLSREEVLHVAHLGKLYLNDEEIEKYKIQLKQIMDEVIRLRLDIKDLNFLVSPSDNINIYSNHEIKQVDREKILSNSCNGMEFYWC